MKKVSDWCLRLAGVSTRVPALWLARVTIPDPGFFFGLLGEFLDSLQLGSLISIGANF